ncbi:hypothetical protein ACFW04_013891 [Cataglyphis niger]
MNKLLKIGIWNANGLSNHIQELKHFANDYEIDIIMISEIHFTSKSYVSVPRYSTYYTLHSDGSTHSGTAIIIRSNIKHYEARSYRMRSVSRIERIDRLKIYSSLRPNIQLRIANMRIFSVLLATNSAGGDFNAKHALWGSKALNSKGRELHKAVQNLHLHTVSTGEPTYWPSDSRKTFDLLDFCITKGMSRLRVRSNSCLELSSDHSPIIVDGRQDRLNKPRMNPSSNSSEIPIKCSADIIEKLSEKRKIRKQWQNTRCPLLKTKLNKIIKEI